MMEKWWVVDTRLYYLDLFDLFGIINWPMIDSHPTQADQSYEI